MKPSHDGLSNDHFTRLLGDYFTSIEKSRYSCANLKTAEQQNTNASSLSTSSEVNRIRKSQPSGGVGGGVRIIMRARGKKRGPILTIASLLITLLVGASIFTTISYAPLHFARTIAERFNSNVAMMTKVDQQLLRAKLSEYTKGQCRAVKVLCRFKTFNMKNLERKFELANQQSGVKGRIDVEFDDSKGWGSGRGKLKAFVYTDEDGKVTRIDDPGKIKKFPSDVPDFNKIMSVAMNPKFHSLKTKGAMKFQRIMGVNYNKKLFGTTKKDLDSDLEKSVHGSGSVNQPRLKPETDEEGNQTGRYLDEDGDVVPDDQVKEIKKVDELIKDTPNTQKLLSGAVNGVRITGAIDSACTVYNLSRLVENGAKVLRQRQLIQYAMVANTTIHASIAGDTDPEQYSYIADKLAQKDTREKVIDESKWHLPGTASKAPLIDNPNYGKNAYDSAFYKIAAHNDTPKLTSAEKRFTVGGGGLNGTLSSINNAIAVATGASSPEEISRRCGYIQNPLVRGTSLVIGVIGAIGSFGLTTVATVAGSLALAFAAPYLAAQLAEMAAGEVVTSETNGPDSGNAITAGTDAYYQGVTRHNGGTTLTPEEAAEYGNITHQTQLAYAEIDKIDGKNNPFDPTNRYSFFGTIIHTLMPVGTSASKGGRHFIASLGGVYAASFASLQPSVLAAENKPIEPDFFRINTDTFAQNHNIAVSPTGAYVYGQTMEAYNKGVDETVMWMVNNNQINDSGEPIDNDDEFNYKAWREQCVDEQEGVHEETENDDNGASCSDPKYRSKIAYFSKYATLVTGQEIQDGDLPGMKGQAPGASPSRGDRTLIGENGWAFPTVSDAIISSGFRPPGRPNHQGLDIAGPGILGKPIFATKDGTVVRAGPAQGFGNWIVIEHEDDDGEKLYTVYGHMYSDGLSVRVGESVEAGQEIGRIGNDGQSTGPHLHYEIWKGGRNGIGGATGQPIDPTEIVEKSRNTQVQGGRP